VILLREYAQAAGLGIGLTVARLILPLLVLAELFSWHGVVTTFALSHAFEESLWTISAAMLTLCTFLLSRRASPELRGTLAGASAFGIAYLTFMCTVDVPMYVSRWLADQASGHQTLSLAQGLWEVSHRWIVTFRWEDWASQMPWMTLYFSLAVWASLAFVLAPPFRRRAEAPGTR
jgi:hypothetical protein